MSLKPIVACLLVVAAFRQTQADPADLQASLRCHPSRDGWMVLTLRNTGPQTFRFADVEEGGALCGQFYRIVVKRGDKTFETSPGATLYAPGGRPRLIEIGPGEVYEREIQPSAYGLPPAIKPPCWIAVRYAIAEEGRQAAAAMSGQVNLDLTFQTGFVRVESMPR